MSNIVTKSATKKSGKYDKGEYHSNGGIKVTVDGVKDIEVEKDEYHICRAAIESEEVYEFSNKSNEEILEKLFREEGCVFEMGKAQSGDAIICKLVVNDKKKRSVKGKVRDILNKLQTEKSCNLITNDGKKYDMAKCGCQLEDGGAVFSDILLAPNGKHSNLTPEQYHLVRTPEFKAWFGDWENSPEMASKVVDENGEPLVCYHSDNYPCDSEKHQINVFDVEQKYENTRLQTPSGKAFYFALDINLALEFSRCSYEVAKYRLYQVFLNVRNPSNNLKTLSAFAFDDINEINNSIKTKENCDGVYLHNNFFDEELGDNVGYADQIVVFYSNQIKLADGSNTTFDGNNPDIRYDSGGEVNILSISPKDLDNFYAKVKSKSRVNKIYIPPYEKNSGSSKIKRRGGGMPELIIWKNGDIFDYYKFKRIPTFKEIEIKTKFLAQDRDIEKIELRVWIADEYNHEAQYLLDDHITVYDSDIRYEQGGSLKIDDFKNEFPSGCKIGRAHV